MNPISIVVLDDDPDIREGLYDWLSETFSVECFASPTAFLNSRYIEEGCDCLLLDLRMPEMTGIELQNELSRSEFSSPIIFMSGDAQKADIISAWRKGAYDFILKPFSVAEITSAIENVLLAKRQRGESNQELLLSLPITRREAQVLLLLGEGLQQQQVADRLNLSLRTVKMYRNFLKNKLDLKNLAEIGVFCALHQDLIKKSAE